MGADDNRRMSRRAWFSRVLAPLKPVAKTKPPGPNPHLEVAVIAARSCLPYQGTACTMCSDQCPVPGAIAFEENLPVIVPEICTGRLFGPVVQFVQVFWIFGFAFREENAYIFYGINVKLLPRKGWEIEVAELAGEKQFSQRPLRQGYFEKKFFFCLRS
jgi:hypothetical protein